jgi:hypothetical protein
MRSILGLIAAGGIVLSQAGDAKAQVTFSLGGGGSPAVTLGQPYGGGYGNGYGYNPGYSQVPSYGYNPGYSQAPSYGYGSTTTYRSYNSGYQGYANPYSGYTTPGAYGYSYPNANPYGGYSGYGNSPYGGYSGYGNSPYGGYSGYGYSSGVNVQTPVGVIRLR